MAIPTWRNVNATSNVGANALLVSAGRDVASGINTLGSTVQNLDNRQQANDAQAFTQNLSSNIGNFGGDQQQYRDFVTQQAAGNQSLSPEQRVATIDSAVQEQDAMLGLNPMQQQEAQQLEQVNSRNLEDLGFSQQVEDQNLTSELGYPLERFDWQNDSSLDVNEVKTNWAHLKDSGLNVQNIQDTLDIKLGRKATGKELEGLIIDAAHGDMSLFNDNNFEVTNNWWSKLTDSDLDTVIDKYTAGISAPEGAKKVRKLRRSQEDARQSVTQQGADNITNFTNQQRSTNANALKSALATQRK